MKYLVIILSLSCIFTNTSLHAQWILEDWEYSTGFAIEEHDKRLYDFTPDIVQYILEHEDDPGTYHTYYSLRKTIYQDKLFAVKAGIGYSHEVITFSRPMNMRPFGFLNKPLVLVDKYRKNMFQFPIIAHVYAIKLDNLKIYLTGDITTSVTFQKGGLFSLGYYVLELNAVEVNPGIGFKIGNIGLEINYRVYQQEKRDEVLFGTFLGSKPWEQYHPDLLANYHFYNPKKFWFTLNYDIDNLQALWKKPSKILIN